MSDLIKLILGYCDNQGTPGTIQSDGTYDGGDSAAIIGTINTLGDLPYPLSCPIVGIFDEGIPARHWDASKWYGQADRFSRDQLIPNICSLIVFSAANSYFSLPFGNPNNIANSFIYEAHKRRWFVTAWNTKGNGKIDMPDKFPDITGPEIWSLWLRYKKPFWMRLFLCLFDVETLIGAIQWRWFTPATNQITRNHMLVSIVAREHSPTLISRLTYRINNWPDLVDRWEKCNKAVGEYPTYPLFREYLKLK